MSQIEISQRLSRQDAAFALAFGLCFWFGIIFLYCGVKLFTVLVRAFQGGEWKSSCIRPRRDSCQRNRRLDSTHQQTRATNPFARFFVNPKSPVGFFVLFNQARFFIAKNEDANPCS